MFLYKVWKENVVGTAVDANQQNIPYITADISFHVPVYNNNVRQN